MELREARPSDFAAIARLIENRAELFWIYPQGDYPLTPAQLHSLAEVRSDLTVATQGGAVIGFANLYDIEPGDSAFIGNVVIGQAFRGQGRGAVLMRYMVNLAFSKYALREVRIAVFSDNLPALLLYSKMGFRPCSVEERRDGEGRRVALLQLVVPKETWLEQQGG